MLRNKPTCPQFSSDSNSASFSSTKSGVPTHRCPCRRRKSNQSSDLSSAVNVSPSPMYMCRPTLASGERSNRKLVPIRAADSASSSMFLTTKHGFITARFSPCSNVPPRRPGRLPICLPPLLDRGHGRRVAHRVDTSLTGEDVGVHRIRHLPYGRMGFLVGFRVQAQGHHLPVFREVERAGVRYFLDRLPPPAHGELVKLSLVR